jgi:hypothetical protein
MTTILTSYSLVPELQHYFNNFVINSQLNKGIVPHPVDIAETYMPENSFIELLFNDGFSGASYEYRYVEESNVGCIPRASIARLQIYPGSWSYLVLDADGDNIFNLQNDDFVLLDALLAFRNGASDSTSLIMIDSTDVSFVQDTTAGISILYGDYDSLSTTLSKLIYLYLRLELYNDFSLYDNDSIVSSNQLVESCFEAYLIEKYFIFMTEREPDLIYNCQCDE